MPNFLVQHLVDQHPSLFGMSMVYQGQERLQQVRSIFNLCTQKLTSCQTSFLFAFLVAGHNASVLILRNISRSDSGRVDCSATNTLSTVNRQFLLNVRCKNFFDFTFNLI